MFAADVACVTRSAAARGELADLARAMKGARALMARDWSMVRERVMGGRRVVDSAMFDVRQSTSDDETTGAPAARQLELR